MKSHSSTQVFGDLFQRRDRFEIWFVRTVGPTMFLLALLMGAEYCYPGASVVFKDTALGSIAPPRADMYTVSRWVILSAFAMWMTMFLVLFWNFFFAELVVGRCRCAVRPIRLLFARMSESPQDRDTSAIACACPKCGKNFSNIIFRQFDRNPETEVYFE